MYMGIVVNQDEYRSELQKRLAAELQERAKKKQQGEAQTDSTKDSAMLKNTAEGFRFGWIAVIAAVVIIGVAIWLTTKLVGQ